MVRLAVLEDGNALDLSGTAQLGSRDRKGSGASLLLKSSPPEALWSGGRGRHARFLVRDRACRDSRTRHLALAPDFTPVVLPLGTRLDPWEYAHRIYKRCNETDRLLRRLKGMSPHLLRFGETRCPFPRIYSVCSHLRGASLVLTGPSRFSRSSGTAATAS